MMLRSPGRMTIDERGFDSEARNLNDLSIDELRLFAGDICRENSKLGLKVRMLQNEISQLKMWADSEGLKTENLIQIRQDVMNKFLLSLPEVKKKAGRPTSFKIKADTANLWSLYKLRDDKKLALKPWLRQQFMESFDNHNASTVSRAKEIARRVNQLAMRMGRNKPSA
jgi:hypothetical protein